MDIPNINTIKDMPKKDLDALNSKLMKRLAAHMVGMVFLKLSIHGVTHVLARKALVVAAKRV